MEAVTFVRVTLFRMARIRIRGSGNLTKTPSDLKRQLSRLLCQPRRVQEGQGSEGRVHCWQHTREFMQGSVKLFGRRRNCCASKATYTAAVEFSSDAAKEIGKTLKELAGSTQRL